MRKEYNNTLIFYIKTLKDFKKIKTWKEAAGIYYKITGEEISHTSLSRLVSQALITNAETQEFSKYVAMTDTLMPKVEEVIDEPTIIDDKEKLPKSLMHGFAIKVSDLLPIFGVDLENDSEDEVNYKLRQQIADTNKILEYMNYDPGLYDLKVEFGNWTTPVKIQKKDGTNELIVVLNDRVRIEPFLRKVPFLHFTQAEYDQYLSTFLKEHGITSYELSLQKLEKKLDDNKNLDNQLLLVSPGLELHLGKLGAISDFEDYSTKHAMARIELTTQAIYMYQKQVKAGKFLLGVGNDFYNSDTVDDKTPAGTQQNNDSRPKEIYIWGKVGYMSLIETLKNSFDQTIVKYNPGNHDELSSYHLFQDIYTKYVETTNGAVSIDTKVIVPNTFEDIRFTNGYVHGDYFVVFSHGKAPQTKRNQSDSDLVSMVSHQFPDECAKAKHIYIFAGHLHSDYTYNDEEARTTVLRSAALCGHGDWDAVSGYTGQRQGHTVYLIDAEVGLIDSHRITFSKEQKLKKIAGIEREKTTEVYAEMNKTLNLNEVTAKQALINSRTKLIETKINLENQKYESAMERLLKALKINECTIEQKYAILEEMGYYNIIEPLARHLELTLALKM